MEGPTTFCCVGCRLLQAPTTACAECGAPTVAPVELVRELLHYRDMKMASGRDWAFITAMIAGTSVAYPVLAPVALGSIVALGVSRLLELRRRRTIVGVDMPRVTPAANATTVVGLARRFRSTVSSLVGEGQVLAEHAVVRDKNGGVLMRRSTATTFLLDRGREGSVIVSGPQHIVSPGLFGSRPTHARVLRDDPRLRRMGVPADLAIAGSLEASYLVESEHMIAVTGVLADESVAELAFHRDGGTTAVMRGTAGAPVLVEDPRFTGAVIVR